MTDSEKIFGAKIGDIVFGALLVDKFNHDGLQENFVYDLNGNVQYFFLKECLNKESFLSDFDYCKVKQKVNKRGMVTYSYNNH